MVISTSAQIVAVDTMSKEVKEVVVVTDKKSSVVAGEGIRVVDASSDEGKELIGNAKTPLPQAFAVMRTVKSCQVVKEEGKLVAKCDKESVDLGTVDSEKAVEKVGQTNEEECPTCGAAIAVGWAINYIRPLNDLIANRVFEDVTDEKITADEAMNKCIQVARQHGKAELVDTLEHLKEMMHKPMAELEKETR